MVILSDPVGFISDLPTQLVAAFRATLEEVVEADLILHVRDISDPDSTTHAANVEEVLASLGVDPADKERVVEVWNKIDLLSEEDRKRLLQDTSMPPVAISAISGEGIDKLIALIEERLSGKIKLSTFTLPPEQLGLLDSIYRLGEVTDREDHEDGSVTLHIRTTEAARDSISRKLRKKSKGKGSA